MNCSKWETRRSTWMQSWIGNHPAVEIHVLHAERTLVVHRQRVLRWGIPEVLHFTSTASIPCVMIGFRDESIYSSFCWAVFFLACNSSSGPLWSESLGHGSCNWMCRQVMQGQRMQLRKMWRSNLFPVCPEGFRWKVHMFMLHAHLWCDSCFELFWSWFAPRLLEVLLVTNTAPIPSIIVRFRDES